MAVRMRRVLTAARPASLLRHASTVPTRVAVVSPLDNPALKDLPADVQASFLLGHDLPSLASHGSELAAAEALLWIPPAAPSVLHEVAGHMPNLKWAHGFYAGVDPIASFAATELAPRGIPLTNGRGAFSSSLAEWALCSAMHFVKQLPRCVENKKAKTWDKFVMGEMRGRTLGLLGAGSIAQATAKLAKAFGMNVVALRRNARKPEPADNLFDLVLGPYDGPILPAHKAALLQQSDVVVCTLPGTEQTRHFMSTAEFAAMRDGAVFVSLGRGVAVDEAALDAALRSGRLGGAALDVFETEPLPAHSPLWDAAHGERLYVLRPATTPCVLPSEP